MFRFSFGEKVNEIFEKEYDFYRKRIFFWISLVASLVVLALSLNHFFNERLLLGSLTFFLSNFLLFNSILFYRRRNILFTTIPIFLLTIVTLGFSIKEQGIIGIFWSYPAILVIHFLLDWRLSLPMNLSLICTVLYASSSFLAWEVVFRIALSLIFTLSLTHLFSALIFRIYNKVKDLAIRDPLTGAFNRRQLELILSIAQERFRRYATEACILAIDVDHFKSINDTYGHGVGDLVLTQIVKIIQSKIRKLDSIYRIGGEEFIVFLPDTNLDGAYVVAEKIRHFIGAAQIINQRVVTVSIGIAKVRTNESIQEWIHRCDILLYKAKAEGRNRIVSETL